MKRLTLGKNLGSQTGLTAVLLLIAGMDDLEPWHRMVGVLVIGCLMALVSYFAQHSEPPKK
jgi:hypothetical protein